MGALMPGGSGDGAPWHPCDENTASVLEKAGFAPETVLGELEIDLSGRKNPYSGAQGFALRHGMITVRSMPLNSEKTCRAAFACSEDAHALGYEAFARVCGRIAQLCLRAFALVAYAGDEPVGWLLCVPEKDRRAPARLREALGSLAPSSSRATARPNERLLFAPVRKRLRLLHMQIRTPFRRGAAAAALLERAWDEAGSRGVSAVRASTIDLVNEASLRMAKAAGGYICNAYGVYLRDISTRSRE